ncbi:MAG: cupin domain-containing protein [Acidobacteria bacterium]|nr:cupin domain-containing protein [Acidobacteriota bacterium]MBI3426885.1 cupin domain-containing protein [Acidobacteriota bacterium]
MKLTKRDLTVALLAASATWAGVSFARDDKPIMGSSVWDWNKIAATPNTHGAVRKFFQAPTATLDELECHVTTLNPGESPHAPHQHADEEIVIVKEGTVESLVGGEKHILGPGSVIFQASNQMHAIRNVGKTPATYHVFKWNSPGMLKAKSEK